MFSKRVGAVLSAALVAGAALVGCSNSESGSSASGDSGYTIGINQLVQHPALDSATAGFQKAFTDAGVTVDWQLQNANGEQATALTIAQQFASQDLDMVLAVATPAAQASVQNITNIPVMFTAVTDPVSAELVDSLEAPGGNVTGTSDVAPIEDQLDLLRTLVPEAKKVGIVYSSGEVNSQVQVDAAKEAAASRDMEIVTQTVTSVTEIQQAVDALGDVDAIYVPTDNTIVSGISSLVQITDQKKIPVIAAEPGTVEGGALATLGIDYEALGYQTGEMALKVLRDGVDPATLPVETATEFTYVINEAAMNNLGITIPAEILEQADLV